MATSAIETAKQENGSRVFFESVIEKNVEPSTNVMKKVYDGYNLQWKITYRKQVAAVKEYIDNEKGYDYSRDSGTMPFIENIAKTDCGVSVKDRWNPMDIVMVKKNMKIIFTMFVFGLILWEIHGKWMIICIALMEMLSLILKKI